MYSYTVSDIIVYYETSRVRGLTVFPLKEDRVSHLQYKCHVMDTYSIKAVSYTTGQVFTVTIHMEP